VEDARALDQAMPDRFIMNCRHLLEQHQLARQLFNTINQWLSDAGYLGADISNPQCSLAAGR